MKVGIVVCGFVGSSAAYAMALQKGTCLSLPRILGSSGVVATLRPKLSADEHAGLLRSAETLRKAAREISL